MEYLDLDNCDLKKVIEQKQQDLNTINKAKALVYFNRFDSELSQFGSWKNSLLVWSHEEREQDYDCEEHHLRPGCRIYYEPFSNGFLEISLADNCESVKIQMVFRYRNITDIIFDKTFRFNSSVTDDDFRKFLLEALEVKKNWSLNK